MKRTKSWLDEKLKKKSAFKKRFLEEFHRLYIAEQLIKLRLDANLTQAELVKKIGTAASAISRYENMNYNRYEINTIKKIVEACAGEMKIIIRSIAA